MCGRYTLSKTENLKFMLEEAGFLFDEFSEIRITPRFNIAPSQTVPVVFDDSPGILSTVKWGLVPFWAKDEKIGGSLANARAETVASKPAFRNAFKRHRCLVPADGFYEWQTTPGGKVPHRFTLADGAPFCFAGLWEEWENPDKVKVRTCTLITTTPNALVATVHDRMPVILPRERLRAWMDATTPAETLSTFLVPLPAEQMREYAVSRAVNSARHDGPELIEPAPVGEPPLPKRPKRPPQADERQGTLF